MTIVFENDRSTRRSFRACTVAVQPWASHARRASAAPPHPQGAARRVKRLWSGNRPPPRRSSVLGRQAARSV